jgi:hypothetical protein
MLAHVGFTHLLILYLLTLAYFYFVYTWLAGLSIFFVLFYLLFYLPPSKKNVHRTTQLLFRALELENPLLGLV